MSSSHCYVDGSVQRDSRRLRGYGRRADPTSSGVLSGARTMVERRTVACSSFQKSIDVDTTATGSVTAVTAMTTTAVRSGAKRSENPATAMSPMLFESARAAVSISRTNVRSCHTLSRVASGTRRNDPARDRCRRCRRNAMARGVVLGHSPRSAQQPCVYPTVEIGVCMCPRVHALGTGRPSQRGIGTTSGGRCVCVNTRACAYIQAREGTVTGARDEGEREWNGDEERCRVGERDRQDRGGDRVGMDGWIERASERERESDKGLEQEKETETAREAEKREERSGVRPRGTKENSGTSLHLPGRV